ncbi:Periplasmic nitrate reductase [Bienertia sinuspersici]
MSHQYIHRVNKTPPQNPCKALVNFITEQQNGSTCTIWVNLKVTHGVKILSPLTSSPSLAPFSSSRPRRFSFAPSRNFAELGCTQSLLPFNATIPRLTAHLSTDARAFSELFNGTFCRTCQDR